LTDLSPFEGSPFETARHVGQPNVGDIDAFLALARGALERRRLTNHGPYVTELEARLTRQLGVKHCIAVSNATAGLEVGARALNLTGEVIVPAFTFVATAHALKWVGLQPVFCDIDPKTHLLDVEHARSLITPRTSAILGVHLWGQSCQVEALEALCHERGLALLYDAAHAFGCAHRGVPLGNFGQLAVFSFHATKLFTTGEGGVITTNDDALAERLRRMITFGFVDVDCTVDEGINAKLAELPAALGLVNLERVPAFLAANLRNYRAYAEGLAGLPGLRLLRYSEAEDNSHQYVVLELDERAGCTRDELVAYLKERNVLARRYFTPGCHRHPRTGNPGTGPLPGTELACARVCCLPTGSGVSEEDVARICGFIAQALRR
jgi:dTDP-4-amino-4,6-dideoxygalactose transaminase